MIPLLIVIIGVLLIVFGPVVAGAYRDYWLPFWTRFRRK